MVEMIDALEDEVGMSLDFSEENNIEDMYLTFFLSGERYAAGLSFVTEVVRMRRVMEVPDVPAFIKGVINLRGKVIPVMDMRLRFGMEDRDYTDRSVIIVLDVDDMPVGLAVDAVSDVRTIPSANINLPPQYGNIREGKGVIQGIGKQGDEISILINIRHLISDQAIDFINDFAGIV